MTRGLLTQLFETYYIFLIIFRALCGRFQSHLGPQNRTKIDLQIDQKIKKKLALILYRLFYNFGSILEAKIFYLHEDNA